MHLKAHIRRIRMDNKMRISCFSFLALICWISISFGQNTATDNYVEVKAQSGDGVRTLLARYKINTSCNRSHFYTINGVSRKRGLRLNKNYKLPLYVYTYNGKSIRSTIGIDDFDQAVRIQKFNEFMFAAELKTDDYRKDKILWVPHHELECPDEVVEVELALEEEKEVPKKVKGTFDIFGSDYEEVLDEGNDLKGCVYYMVSGHGGRDPGAVGRYARKNLCEDEYAYDISLRIARKLISHGATVYIIVRDPDDGIRDDSYLPCDKDEIYWGDSLISNSQSMRLMQRSNTVNTLYEQNKRKGVQYQRLVVLHIDSEDQNERVDMFFYHKEEDEEGKTFADGLLKTVKKKYAEVQKGRGYWGFVRSRDLHMLRETLPTTVFIELGNIKNPGDQLRFVRTDNRKLISKWLFEGLLQDRVSKKK